jgi:hypothetical protein
LQSNNFNTTWTLYSVTATSGQAGYDGSSDAWEISTTGVNGFENLNQNISFSGVHTISMYAKAGSNNYLTMRSLGTDIRVQFKLDDGTHSTTFGNPIDTFMEDAGGGWYRCGFTANFSSAYIETTTTAIYGGITDNVPRLDYTDSSCPALLLEPQRTNIVPQSEYLGGWSAINCSLTANSITSPEGVINSFKITENSAASTQHRVAIGVSSTSAIHTMSAYVKNSSGSRMAYIDMGPVTGHFNFATETMYSAQGTANWEDAGDGWYRISITSNTAVTPVTAFAGLSVNNSETYSGDGSSAIEFYGIQLEQGSYATSYIPTYGSAVTRNADDCNVTSITDIVGQTEGTLYAEVDVTSFKQGVTSEIILSAYSNTANRIMMSLDGIGTKGVYIFIRSFSSSYDLYTPKSFSLGTNKLAFSYGENYRAVYLNGEKINESTSTFVVPPIPNLAIGRRDDNSGQFADGIKQTLIFNTRLTDQEAIDLTTL